MEKINLFQQVLIYKYILSSINKIFSFETDTANYV